MGARKPAKSRGRAAGQAVDEPHGSVQLSVEKPAEDDVVDDALEALASELDTLDDPSGFEVILYEINDRGRREFLRRYEPGEFTAHGFAAEYGGGNYIWQVKETTGQKRFRKERAFTISKLVEGKRRKDARADAAASAPVKTDDKMLTLALAMMQQSQQQSQAMMQQQTQLLTAMMSRPADLSMRDLLPLLMGKGDPQGVSELIKGLQALDELRGDGGGGAERSGGGGEWGWVGPVLAEMMKAGAAQPPRRHVENTARPPRPQGARPPQPTQASTQAAAGTRAPGRSSPPRTAAAGVSTPPASAASSPPPKPAAPSPAPSKPALKLAQDEPDDAGEQVQIAHPAQTMQAITKSLIGAIMMGNGVIDPKALADELLATLHDESLAAMLDALEEGALVANVEALIPAPLKPGITDATREAVAELERLLRAGEADEDEQDQDDAGDDDDQGEPAA